MSDRKAKKFFERVLSHCHEIVHSCNVQRARCIDMFAMSREFEQGNESSGRYRVYEKGPMQAMLNYYDDVLDLSLSEDILSFSSTERVAYEVFLEDIQKFIIFFLKCNILLYEYYSNEDDELLHHLEGSNKVRSIKNFHCTLYLQTFMRQSKIDIIQKMYEKGSALAKIEDVSKTAVRSVAVSILRENLEQEESSSPEERRVSFEKSMKRKVDSDDSNGREAEEAEEEEETDEVSVDVKKSKKRRSSGAASTAGASSKKRTPAAARLSFDKPPKISASKSPAIVIDLDLDEDEHALDDFEDLYSPSIAANLLHRSLNESRKSMQKAALVLVPSAQKSATKSRTKSSEKASSSSSSSSAATSMQRPSPAVHGSSLSRQQSHIIPQAQYDEILETLDGIKKGFDKLNKLLRK